MEIDFTLVDTTTALKSAANALADASTFYIDTEFESRNNDKTLCLLQISSGNEIYLIDCLRLSAMRCLSEVIAGSHVEWVLHDGSQDIELILAKLGLSQLPRIFDTQVAWGLMGAEHRVPLTYLIYKVLGIRAFKEYQADPWNRRPIPNEQLEYAAGDVAHLPALREALGKQLENVGKSELIYDVSREFCSLKDNTSVVRKSVTIEDFHKTWELDHDGNVALLYLVEWYNSLPNDELPFKPYALFLIARRLPQSGEELAAIKGIPSEWARREGDVLMGRMIRATYEARDNKHPMLEPPPYMTFREIQSKAFLTVTQWHVCERIMIAPELAFPRWLMDRLHEKILRTGDIAAGIEEFDGWRKVWLSEPYAAVCRKLQGWQ